MSRKAIERETRRQFVVGAARRLFADKGIEETSMEDIAEAVDYTRRTLYAYFKSRDEICLMVLIEDMNSRWEMQKMAINHAERGLEKVIAWGEAFYRFARGNPQSMRLHFYWDFKGVDRNKIGKKVFTAFEKINDELAEGLREIFRLGVADGSLRPDLKIDMCISQYLYSLRSVINRALAKTYSFAKFKPDDYMKHYLDLFSRGICNQGELIR